MLKKNVTWRMNQQQKFVDMPLVVNYAEKKMSYGE
jgi:hypothetical protein